MAPVRPAVPCAVVLFVFLSFIAFLSLALVRPVIAPLYNCISHR